jgi:hypothetical protein
MCRSINSCIHSSMTIIYSKERKAWRFLEKKSIIISYCYSTWRPTCGNRQVLKWALFLFFYSNIGRSRDDIHCLQQPTLIYSHQIKLTVVLRQLQSPATLQFLWIFSSLLQLPPTYLYS